MDLDRNAFGQATELGRRDAGVEQQGALGSGPGLGQLLRRQHAQREPGVDQFGRQALGGLDSAFEQGAEALLLGEPHPFVQVVKGPAFVKVRGVDGVPALTQSLGEIKDPGVRP